MSEADPISLPRLSYSFARRYGVSAVPAVVVNGKYHIDNRPEILDIIDELLVREGVR